MVLKSIYFLLISFVFVVGSTDGPLLSKYKSKIEKDLRKYYGQATAEYEMYDEKYKDDFLERYKVKLSTKSEALLFFKEVKSCNLNGCTTSQPRGADIGSEYYDISVLTDADMNIQSIRVLDYFSDYGYQIASRRYLKKYVGKNLCSFSSEKPQVDGITGATISYNALINSLEEFCEFNK